MDTIIAAPASCEVRSVIRFLHAQGQSAATITPEVDCETVNKFRRSIKKKKETTRDAH
jgi:hypothetical protein